MDNPISEHILLSNIDILLEVMSMLEAEDQLAFARVHKNIEKAFLEHIWKRKFNLNTNIIEFDENFKALIDKNCQKITTLRVNGGQVHFNSDRLKKLVYLTEIRLNDVTLCVDDVYCMARIATNLEILILENISYKWLPSVDKKFKVESLKILHLPYYCSLRWFITNCPNLEELIIYKIPESNIKYLKHSLLSLDIIKSTLDDIWRDYTKVCEKITKFEMEFEITAKKDQATIINIHAISLNLNVKCEKFIENFNLMHLKNVKMLYLNFYHEHYNHIEFTKLLSENCKLLKSIEIFAEPALTRGLNINKLLSLRKIIINVHMSGEDLFNILKNLSLYSFELNGDLSYDTKSPQTQTYGNFITVFKYSGCYTSENNIEMFFQLYPNGFQNLKELCLYAFDCIERTLELALKQFRNIKHLEIEPEALTEKTLATLIQFPLLKYLKIEECPDLKQDQMESLRKHIDWVF